jgi:hypothetical protein
MAVAFRPHDLLERAAQEDENWTEEDRRHCARMLHDAFEESFQVEEIQQTQAGLIAYGAPFISVESVRFEESEEKPVLQALEALSKKLLLSKPLFRGSRGL